jgi:hypothetical protein
MVLKEVEKKEWDGQRGEENLRWEKEMREGELGHRDRGL